MFEPYRTGYIQVDDIHHVYYACYGKKQGKPILLFMVVQVMAFPMIC